MKRVIIFSLLPVLAIFILVAAQNAQPVPAQSPDDIDLGWPDEVMALLGRSCFDCHTKDASNIKAKQALNFSKWGEYKLTKQIGKLNGISEEVKEKKMPPEKFINNKPDAAFSDEEITTITSWANAEAQKLMEE